MSSKAKQMKADGINVVNFAAGEPDFDTPKSIVEAGKTALDQGKTRYTPTPGDMALREAIAEKLLRVNGLTYAPQQIIVGTGGKQCLYNALQILVGPGDEVVLPAPFWMTYESQVRLAGAKPVIVSSSAATGFVPDVGQIAAACNSRTRAIVFCSPTNPTGAVFPRETLEGIAKLAEERDLWIVTDEIYENLVYGAQHVSIATLSKETQDRTVTVSGCSKSFAMTGWRIGYAAAPLDVIKAMTNLQDQVTSGATTFSQYGAIAAMRLPKEETEAMRKTFEKRRDLIVSLLREVPQVTTNVPMGAFYVFPDVSAYLGGRFADDLALAEFLLDEAKVASVPGSVFYGPGHLRLSYATSEADIREGVSRIASTLATV